MPKVKLPNFSLKHKRKRLTLEEKLQKAEDKLRRNGEPDIEQEIVDIMAKEISNEIDKMILEKLMKGNNL
jgi:hypothetical protein